MGRQVCALALVVLAAAGCATRASYRRLMIETGNLRAELTELRRAQETTARDVGRALADFRSLDARVLEVQTGLREAAAELGRLARRVDAAEDDIRTARALGAAKLPAAAPPPPEPSPAAAAPGRAGALPSAEQVYDAAMATFRSRELGQAVLDLLDFIAKYPKHRLAANAQYWIGEAYYAQRDYRQALVEFRKVLEFGPGASKIPDALLKIGLSHANLREPSRARQAWQRVVTEYPSSEAAAKARSLLRERATPRG